MKNRVYSVLWLLILGSIAQSVGAYCTFPNYDCPLEDGFYSDVPWLISSSTDNLPVFAIIDGSISISCIKVYDGFNLFSPEVDKKCWDPPLQVNTSNSPYWIQFNINRLLLANTNNKHSIKLEFKSSDSLISNWEGIQEIITGDPPKFSDWQCGDIHYHSSYTNNPTEFGGDLEATKKSAKAIGLEWVTVTDHSFDLDSASWLERNNKLNLLSDSEIKLLVGEEISCLARKTEPIKAYSHYLAYTIPYFIPGRETEDLGGYIDDIKLCYELPSIVNSQGGFGFVAHPYHSDWFRTSWQNFDLNFSGLEFWNGDDPVNERERGFNKWRELLANGRRVYIEGGSDAHGDFNSRFGIVRTCCKTGSLDTGILSALKNGHCYVTSGPALRISINEKEIGDAIKLHPGFVNLTITAKSSSEFGELKWLETYVDDRPSVRYDVSGYEVSENKLKYLLSSDRYIFAVAETDKGYRAYTNPIWLELENGTCNDGVRNQDESAVDCGGVCPKCGDNKSCSTDADCLSGYCNPDHICSTPSCDDGIWNEGFEEGVDCGGNCSACTAAGILNATVWNIGRGNASNVVVWYYDGQPSDDTYLGGRVIASLAVNESNVTQFYWNATAGNHTICVLVDPENLTVEENESNTSVICCVRPIKIILIKKNERIGGSDKRYGGRENGKQYKYGFSN